jgi:NhaA family Na+:H+ antiporter
MQFNVLRQFLRLESSSGIILFAMGVAALIICNSPLLNIYHAIFQQPVLFGINEGLMTIFFLLVGLELKRGFTEGQLSQPSRIMLPAIAALGGMVIPALFYGYINYDNPLTIKGWSIPVATDIAFALGFLSLFGRRVPFELKLFLMSLAIFDDVGAIIIIAFLHSNALSYHYLLIAVILLAGMWLMNVTHVRHWLLYILPGFAVWLCMLNSGIHATVAGVLLAFTIPAKKISHEEMSPLHYLEKKLHPWVAFGIMPLFVLANAGISFAGVSTSMLTDTVTLGIFLGLFLGKQFGVLIFSWIVVRLGWAELPKASHWLSMYGVAILCGVGFTMSLFLGTLVFQGNSALLIEVRLGVLSASIVSGIMGSIILHYALPKGRKVELR